MRFLLPKAIISPGFLALTLANTGLAPHSATTGWDATSDDFRHHVEASETAPGGPLVTFVVDQSIRHHDPKFYSMTENTRYSLGRELLYEHSTTCCNGQKRRLDSTVEND